MLISKKKLLNKLLTDTELADELNVAGINAWSSYEKMGKSADKWNELRLSVARELQKRCYVLKVNKP